MLMLSLLAAVFFVQPVCVKADTAETGTLTAHVKGSSEETIQKVYYIKEDRLPVLEVEAHTSATSLTYVWEGILVGTDDSGNPIGDTFTLNATGPSCTVYKSDIAFLLDRANSERATYTCTVSDGMDTVTITFILVKDTSDDIGWYKNQNGWIYIDPKDGGVMTNQWAKISGNWYYFKDILMVTGWQKIDAKWYYFNTSGAMQTGWQQIGGKWYYLDASGVMKTGWQKIANVWYYFNAGGDMATGWKTIGGKTYYFKDSGAMAANEWCKGYWLNADGTWTYKYKASWKKDSKGWYYQDTSGWYAKSCTVRIDGKSYTFDASGYMK